MSIKRGIDEFVETNINLIWSGLDKQYRRNTEVHITTQAYLQGSKYVSKYEDMQQEITCLVVAMRRQRNIRIHKMILECLEER